MARDERLRRRIATVGRPVRNRSQALLTKPLAGESQPRVWSEIAVWTWPTHFVCCVAIPGDIELRGRKPRSAARSRYGITPGKWWLPNDGPGGGDWSGQHVPTPTDSDLSRLVPLGREGGQVQRLECCGNSWSRLRLQAGGRSRPVARI